MSDTNALPLFFRSVATLDRAAHAGLRLDGSDGFNFARATNAVPLSLSELGVAAAHHPIVFAGDATPQPMAVVGYRDAQNLCVEADGSWVAGSYIPCYLRNYPFIFVQPRPEAEELLLAIETSSPLLSDSKGEPLFEGGEPTALLQQRLALCDSYRRDLAATGAFAKALQEADLLVPQEARLDLHGSGTHRIDGFRMIDAARLSAMADADVLDWWKQGWLAAALAVLHSQARWATLLDRAGQRLREAEAKAA